MTRSSLCKSSSSSCGGGGKGPAAAASVPATLNSHKAPAVEHKLKFK